MRKENAINYMPPSHRKEIKDYLSASSIWKFPIDTEDFKIVKTTHNNLEYKPYPMSDFGHRGERDRIFQKNNTTSVHLGADRSPYQSTTKPSAEDLAKNVATGEKQKSLRGNIEFGNGRKSDQGRHQYSELSDPKTFADTKIETSA